MKRVGKSAQMNVRVEESVADAIQELVEKHPKFTEAEVVRLCIEMGLTSARDYIERVSAMRASATGPGSITFANKPDKED